MTDDPRFSTLDSATALEAWLIRLYSRAVIEPPATRQSPHLVQKRTRCPDCGRKVSSTRTGKLCAGCAHAHQLVQKRAWRLQRAAERGAA